MKAQVKKAIAVLGGTVVVGITFVGLNLLSDLLYRIADPRAAAAAKGQG